MCYGNASKNHELEFTWLEMPKNHNLSKVPKLTAFLFIITTRKEHGWIMSSSKIGTRIILFDVWAFLKKRGLPQKAVLQLDNAPSHPRQECTDFH
jgi:hypothetical protein